MVLAGALSFVVGAMAQAPAALLYGWIAPRANLPVQLLGIEGTLTQGRSAQLRYANQTAAEAVEWHFQPLGLLLARLSYQLQSEKPPLIAAGKVSLGPGGTRIRQLQANTELRNLAAAVGQAFLPLNGSVSIDLASARLKDGWPVDAEGVVQLNGVAWTLGKDPVVLGSYQAELRSGEDQIVATITTLGGSVEVDGTATAHADRRYDYALRLRAKPDAPPMIANLLRQLGAPDAAGYYLLSRQGQSESQNQTAPPSAAANADEPAAPAPAPAAPSRTPLPKNYDPMMPPG